MYLFMVMFCCMWYMQQHMSGCMGQVSTVNPEIFGIKNSQTPPKIRKLKPRKFFGATSSSQKEQTQSGYPLYQMFKNTSSFHHGNWISIYCVSRLCLALHHLSNSWISCLLTLSRKQPGQNKERSVLTSFRLRQYLEYWVTSYVWTSTRRNSSAFSQNDSCVELMRTTRDWLSHMESRFYVYHHNRTYTHLSHACSHEEADTCMLLHVAHAAQHGHNRMHIQYVTI